MKMGRRMTRAKFTVVSTNLARIDLWAEGEIDIDTSHPLQIHEFGLRSAPLYSLQQPFAPDEGWKIWPNSDGRYFDNYPIDSDIYNSLREWRGNGVLPRGIQLLGSLPSGTYYLVPTQLAARETDLVYLGNEAIRPTPNMALLLADSEPVYATVITSPEDARPCFDQVFIGVVVLNASGVTWTEKGDYPYQHSVFFFSLLSSSSANLSGHECILVIPETGKLILDNMILYSTNTITKRPTSAQPNEKSLERWRNYFLPRFLHRCSPLKKE
jgi:hypothetical protein